MTTKKFLEKNLTHCVDPESGEHYICIHEEFDDFGEDGIDFTIIARAENQRDAWFQAATKIYQTLLCLQNKVRNIGDCFRDEPSLKPQYELEYTKIKYKLTEEEKKENKISMEKTGYEIHDDSFYAMFFSISENKWYRSFK